MKARGSTYMQGKLGKKNLPPSPRCRHKQLKCVSALLNAPLLPSNAVKGHEIYYIAAASKDSWRQLCLFHSVGLVVLNFTGHYSCTVHTAIGQPYIVFYRVDLYVGVKFWTFFGLKNGGSTYMRIDLYASIYGMFLTYILKQHIYNNMKCITEYSDNSLRCS